MIYYGTSVYEWTVCIGAWQCGTNVKNIAFKGNEVKYLRIPSNGILIMIPIFRAVAQIRSLKDNIFTGSIRPFFFLTFQMLSYLFKYLFRLIKTLARRHKIWNKIINALCKILSYHYDEIIFDFVGFIIQVFHVTIVKLCQHVWEVILSKKCHIYHRLISWNYF